MTRLVPLPDLLATDALAEAIAAALRPGDAVLLEGALGAGKTALARALLRHAVGDPSLAVPSPSYTLLQHYESPVGTITHFDLWRLAGADDLAELGWDEARGGIVVVEWPDRLGALAPADALRVRLVQPDPGAPARVAALDGWDGRL
jgi:tRNA threonylcarbamoyladenosine biosynthesis protein TsaE